MPRHILARTLLDAGLSVHEIAHILAKPQHIDQIALVAMSALVHKLLPDNTVLSVQVPNSQLTYAELIARESYVLAAAQMRLMLNREAQQAKTQAPDATPTREPSA